MPREAPVTRAMRGEVVTLLSVTRKFGRLHDQIGRVERYHAFLREVDDDLPAFAMVVKHGAAAEGGNRIMDHARDAKIVAGLGVRVDIARRKGECFYNNGRGRRQKEIRFDPFAAVRQRVGFIDGLIVDYCDAEAVDKRLVRESGVGAMAPDRARHILALAAT